MRKATKNIKQNRIGKKAKARQPVDDGLVIENRKLRAADQQDNLSLDRIKKRKRNGWSPIAQVATVAMGVLLQAVTVSVGPSSSNTLD